MRRLLLVLVALVTIAAGAGLWWWCVGGDLVIPVTQGEIQERLEARFPVEKTYLLVIHFRFLHPKVVLEKGSDKLRFLVDIEARFSAGGPPHPGTALVSGTITYDREQGEFYLLGAHLEHITIAGMNDDKLARVQEGADLALGGYLDRKPIYRLKQGDFKQDLARMTLKQVRIEDGKLIVTLSPYLP